MDGFGWRIAIGKNIKAWRKQRKLTLARLAAKVSISYQQLQKYEKGTNAIPADKVILISLALGCSVEQLLFGASGNWGDASEQVAREFMRIEDVQSQKMALQFVKLLADQG